MRNSYLIQRLLKPYEVKEKNGNTLANAFSFGGGFKNGGLSDKAMELTRNIFRFDYMGSAEFEFGAVPRAFQAIAMNADLYVSFKVPVNYKHKNWRNDKVSYGVRDVWVLCPKDCGTEVLERIRKFAINDCNNTKEQIELNAAMAGYEYSKDNAGWLELDNNFMFFIDESMFRKTVNLLGIKEG